MKTYLEQTVCVVDPQDRFKEGYEFNNVTIKLNKEKTEWLVKIPELKPTEKKPQPMELYGNEDAGIKATRRTDGFLQMSWNISNQKRKEYVVGLGIKEVRKLIKKAVDKVWSNLE